LCLANVRVVGDRVVPGFVVDADHPWLSALLDEHARFSDKRRHEWLERMRQPLPVRAPKSKLALAAHVLDRATRRYPATALPPRQARLHLFRAGTESAEPRRTLVERVARDLEVTPSELESALFADLPVEQRVASSSHLGPADLARDCNLDLVTSLIRRARRVRVRVSDGAYALIAQARRSGLICLVERTSVDALVLDVSGPFAIFRHTAVYGRALTELVMTASACPRFEIEAACVLNRALPPHTLVLRSGDPIAGSSHVSAPHASPDRARTKLLAALRRVATDWTVERDPAPLVAGDAMLFPDFELVAHADPARRWAVELLGYWTPAHVCARARRYREAGITRVVLCVDRRRGCADDGADPVQGLEQAGARVVVFTRTLDAAQIVAAIEG
jgi:predicted nuclease of restriction endonuclease-like RecB superfamily